MQEKSTVWVSMTLGRTIKPGTAPMSDTPLTESEIASEENEDDTALALRRKTQEKLIEAREKLTLARKELEDAAAEMSAPRYNPFSRSTASLKQMASELQAAPTPFLPPSTPVPKLEQEEHHEPVKESPIQEPQSKL